MHEYDIVILGGGIAGLSAAIASANENNIINIAVVCCGKGASNEILAFNVPLYAPDSPEIYFRDMLTGGCGINNEGIIKLISNKSVKLVKELESKGVKFSKNNDGYDQRRVSGGSYPRAVYYKDFIGKLIINIMMQECKDLKIDLIYNTRVLKVEKHNDLFYVIGHDKVIRKNDFFVSKTLVLAAGGIGNLYLFTTYPDDIWGDGYSIAYELGAELIDMEFVQFEPTIVVYPPEARGIVMPTALFGDGAILKNQAGERFLYNINVGKEENDFHKDEMAIAIEKEIIRGKGTSNNAVYFDVSRVPRKLLNGYPSLLNNLKRAGVELLETGFVEVAPAAHSHMGGVAINENCQTSIPGLYAAGEVSGGIHGANRLAGNSGTEILIMGEIAGKNAANYVSPIKSTNYSEKVISESEIDKMIKYEDNEKELVFFIQKLISEAAGLVRDEVNLNAGLKALINKREEVTQKNGELQGRILHLFNTTEMIIRAALMRKESRGYHIRSDYPHKCDSEWKKNIHIFKDRNEMKLKT